MFVSKIIGNLSCGEKVGEESSTEVVIVDKLLSFFHTVSTDPEDNRSEGKNVHSQQHGSVFCSATTFKHIYAHIPILLARLPPAPAYFAWQHTNKD